MQVKTKNLAVGALVVLLVGMLWYRVVYSPMTSKAAKDKTAAHEADTQSANLRQALKSNGTPSDKKKTQSATNGAILAAVPVEPSEASFLRALDELRVKSGADWQAVTPGAPALAGDFNTLNIAITAQGTEAEITSYVAGLASLPRVFVIDNISLSPGGSTSAAGSAPAQPHPGSLFLGDLEQVSISGRIFSTPDAAAAARTGTGSTATTPSAGSAGARAGTVNG